MSGTATQISYPFQTQLDVNLEVSLRSQLKVELAIVERIWDEVIQQLPTGQMMPLRRKDPLGHVTLDIHSSQRQDT